MAFIDNRQFIAALKKTGDVVSIKQEIDWSMEAGAIVRRANETQGPAVLFEKLKDYPEGYRIFGGPIATHRRLAMAMGLSPTAPVRSIQEEYEQRTKRPIKPVRVSDGPCKENVMLGDEVDLYHFPAPIVHMGNGGRYIGCWHLVIAKDPDSEWSNWGMYRHMIYDKNHIVGLWRRWSHLGVIFYGKYRPEKRPMPCAIAIGADPLSSMMAGTQLDRGQSEADYAGALLGQPIELVKCETNDILVPAHAEVILEGEILPDERVFEGPFGEFPGYLTPGSHMPLCKVTAITYRTNPILTMCCEGFPVTDGHIATCLTWAVTHKRHLQEHGIPVTGVYLPPEGAGFLIVVGVKSVRNNIATHIRNVILSTLGWQYKIIVVDEDVDVFNLAEVIHAWATKCHPVRGINISDRDHAIPLTPYISPEEREWGKGASVSFDCTWPLDWPKETGVLTKVSFNEIYPEEVKERVLKNWKSYGFE